MSVTPSDSLTVEDRLIAIESIKQLKARYFRTLDTKDWDGFRGVFADSASIGPIDSGLPPSDARPVGNRNPDEFVLRVRTNLAEVKSVHHGHMPEIELISASEAHGVWAMEDHLQFPNGSAVATLHGFGHYHETYVHNARGWQIASMRLTRLRIELT
jgi:hypothetical protein